MPLRIEGDIARLYMRKMKPYRKTAPIMAVQMPDDFIVVQDSDDAEITGEITATRGSYLAMAKNGVLYPIAESTFDEQYVPLENDDDDESP